MHILYYDWDEFNGEDCRDAMTRLGHQVDMIKVTMNGYDLTPEIERAFAEKLGIGEGQVALDGSASNCRYDMIFSFDFFPNISEICQKYGIPYVSWVFDCPHYTLDSHVTSNPMNRIYLFDKILYDQMMSKSTSKTFRYSPLAVNAERLSKLCQDMDAESGGRIVYQHDVCFLGSLYDNEYNFYDQVKYLPPYLKGYVDAVIAAQERVFGADFFTMDSIFSDDHVRQLREFRVCLLYTFPSPRD